MINNVETRISRNKWWIESGLLKAKPPQASRKVGTSGSLKHQSARQWLSTWTSVGMAFWEASRGMRTKGLQRPKSGYPACRESRTKSFKIGIPSRWLPLPSTQHRTIAKLSFSSLVLIICLTICGPGSCISDVPVRSEISIRGISARKPLCTTAGGLPKWGWRPWLSWT